MLKKVLLTLLCSASLSTLQAQHRTAPAADSTETLYEKFLLADDLLRFAENHLHRRYRAGGTSPSGFDCSGFVRYCFQRFGVALPHSSAAQGKLGREVSRANARPGDLIFFKGSSTQGSRIGHVGIVTEVRDGTIRFIHSAWNGGVRFDLTSSAYYRQRFVSIRRVAGWLGTWSAQADSH
jgi:cell wall-associated NlpC family hydrolase